jgi:hypothetical protein
MPCQPVGTLERVADGDTITAISANGTKLRIRLLGTNGPEITHGSKQGSFSVSGQRLSRPPDLWQDGEAGGRCRTDTALLKEAQR